MIKEAAESQPSVWRSILLPGISPKFKKFITSHFQRLRLNYEELNNSLPENIAAIHKEKINSILQDHSRASEQIDGYLNSFKSYTSDGTHALERMEYELVSIVKKNEYLVDICKKNPQELYVLQSISLWDSFYSSLQNIFNTIKHPRFYHLLVIFFGLGFVFVPFLNFLSLFMGLFLINRRDWRAIIWGWIITGLFIAQIASAVLIQFI